MPDLFWALFPGGPNWRKWQSRWHGEVAQAERRLDTRAREEAFMVALRDARAKREPTKPPVSNSTSINYVQPLGPSQPPPLVTTEDEEPEPLAEPTQRFHDYSARTNNGVNRALNRLTRYTQPGDPASLKAELEHDIRWFGNWYCEPLSAPAKHPLHEQYDLARERVVARGEEDPGDVGSIVLHKGVKERVARGLEKKNERMTITYETLITANAVYLNVYTERGFALPKKAPDVQLQRVDSAASVVTVVHAPDHLPRNDRSLPDLTRNRSNTFDDRLIASTELATADGDAVIGDEDLAASLAARSAASTPDPAENIAAYHDRRAQYFDLDAQAGVRETRSL